MADTLKRNGTMVEHCRDAMRSHTSLDQVPSIIKSIIRDGMWRRRFERRLNKEVEFDSFAAFVNTPALEGLGYDYDTVKRICAIDPEALDAIDRAMQRKPGKTWDSRTQENTVDNINNNTRPDGTSRAAGLRRLRKDRPDLHQQVIDGELSVNAACVKAGFRKKKTPLEQLQHWWIKADEATRDEFLDWVRT